MNTTNLISTPNINGNIGSCSTQNTKFLGNRTLFIQEIIQVSTNSCNGAVEKFYTWELTGATLLGSLLIAGFLALVIGVFFSRDPY